MKNRVIIALALVVAGVSANAQTLQVTVQPILCAETNGSNQSPFLGYLDYAAKIYQQANIVLNVLTPTILNNSSYNQFSYANANNLVHAAGGGQNSNPLVVNAWFVDNIVGASVYGFAYLDQPYMIMDTGNIAGYSALGRVDTFSHELGHVLDLPHYSGANAPNNLMASGGVRNIPQSLANVAPDGLAYDSLTQNQINIMRSSQFAQPVPEPATMAVLGLGLAGLAARRRRSA